MLVVFAYIIIPNILVICLMFYSNQKLIGTGSDHASHLSIINRIKENKHKFICDYLFGYNEKYPFYPQLYHWLVSFLPERIYKYKYHYINLAVKTIEIIGFNAFLFYLYRKLAFDEIVFLYTNIVFNTFPFSYAAWNAKNTGLSARGIGLVSGQVYLYFIVAYIISGNFLILPFIFVIVFVSILLSQMALQFILLSMPFVAMTFSIPILFFLPFLAIGLFYIIMPNVAKNYLVGQFNHKRNYALFMADIFILKSRPSIYRDFFWDFWVKLKTNWKHALLYLYGNPLVELVFGFTYLWFVIYIGFTLGFIGELNIIFKLVFISLVLFFVTSFRFTRFLGEPQRYVEFTIPLISILFVIKVEWQLLLPLTIIAVLFAFIPSWVINRNFSTDNKRKKSNLDSLLVFLVRLQKKNSYVFISNDNQLLKYVAGTGHFVCKSDISRFYKNQRAFYKYHHDSSYEKLSPYAISEYYKEYAPNFLIINNELYTIDNVFCHFDKLLFITSFGRYQLYLLNNTL